MVTVGWVPKGRTSEDGVIPERYLGLHETPNDDSTRTDWNVRDACATVIFSRRHELRSYALVSKNCAAKMRRPHLHLCAESGESAEARARPHTQCAAHTVHLPLGGLLTVCVAVCGTPGARREPRRVRGDAPRRCAQRHRAERPPRAAGRTVRQRRAPSVALARSSRGRRGGWWRGAAAGSRPADARASPALRRAAAPGRCAAPATGAGGRGASAAAAGGDGWRWAAAARAAGGRVHRARLPAAAADGAPSDGWAERGDAATGRSDLPFGPLPGVGGRRGGERIRIIKSTRPVIYGTNGTRPRATARRATRRPATRRATGDDPRRAAFLKYFSDFLVEFSFLWPPRGRDGRWPEAK